jgi:TPP-dependent pyruvate/acetoin dehydrogenase alpha subunit
MRRRDEYVFGGHRAPVRFIVGGADISALMAELAGRSQKLDEFGSGDLNATQGNQPADFTAT